MADKQGTSFLTKAVVVLIILVAIMVTINKKSDEPKAVIEVKSQSVQAAKVKTTDPYGMPLSHEEEALALDAIKGIENLATLLKRSNRVEIYQYVKNNEDTMGAECGLEICKNLRYAMRRLEDIAKDPNDMESIRQAGVNLKAAALEATALKKTMTYLITKRKPLFIDSDGTYAVESVVSSRKECKLLGDAIHLTKKEPLVVFVKPGKKITKEIKGNDLLNINCIYRYNFGLKNYTQVLMENEINGNWP